MGLRKTGKKSEPSASVETSETEATAEVEAPKAEKPKPVAPSDQGEGITLVAKAPPKDEKAAAARPMHPRSNVKHHYRVLSALTGPDPEGKVTRKTFASPGDVIEMTETTADHWLKQNAVELISTPV